MTNRGQATREIGTILNKAGFAPQRGDVGRVIDKLAAEGRPTARSRRTITEVAERLGMERPAETARRNAAAAAEIVQIAGKGLAAAILGRGRSAAATALRDGIEAELARLGSLRAFPGAPFGPRGMRSSHAETVGQIMSMRLSVHGETTSLADEVAADVEAAIGDHFADYGDAVDAALSKETAATMGRYGSLDATMAALPIGAALESAGLGASAAMTTISAMTPADLLRTAPRGETLATLMQTADASLDAWTATVEAAATRLLDQIAAAAGARQPASQTERDWMPIDIAAEIVDSDAAYAAMPIVLRHERVRAMLPAHVAPGWDSFLETIPRLEQETGLDWNCPAMAILARVAERNRAGGVSHDVLMVKPGHGAGDEDIWATGGPTFSLMRLALAATSSDACGQAWERVMLIQQYATDRPRRPDTARFASFRIGPAHATECDEPATASNIPMLGTLRRRLESQSGCLGMRRYVGMRFEAMLRPWP